MKVLTITLGLILSILNINKAEAQAQKALIVYYSRTGGTEQIAKYIQEFIQADLFEIETVEEYPAEYRETTDLVKKQILEGYRPKLKAKVDNIAQYDVVFIGSPNWWGTISLPVSAFLEENDLKGKTVVPFVTHGGGGKQKTFTDFVEQCVGCKIIDGFIGVGSRAKSAKSDVEKWIKNLGEAG